MKKFLFASAAAGLTLTAAAAHAQSIDYGAMEQLFNEPVTTSATGSPQRATEAPVDMTIISATDIKRSGATDLPTILSRVGGLDVLSWGASAADVSVHGYDRPMTPRLLVLINGRQAYLDHYGYTAWATLPVQLSEIRQIEVVKGPNSALFGFNAVGGVVNIITFDPLHDDANTVTARVGTSGYREVSLVNTLKLGERVSALLSVGASRSDEWKNTNPTIDSSGLLDPKKVAANLAIVTELTEKTEFRVEGSWSNTQISEMLSNNNYSPTKYITSSLRATLASDSRVGLLELSAYRNNMSEKYNRPGTFDTAVTVVGARDLFKLGARHTFRIAAEYRHNTINTAPIEGGDVSYDVYAASGMWSWAISDKLASTAAVRFDRLDLQRTGVFPASYPAVFTNTLWDRTINETSYNLGLVYRPSEADAFRVSLARGVQLPSLLDLGALQYEIQLPTVSFGAVGNPTLKPTIVENLEFGYERSLPTLGARIGVSIFAQATSDVKGDPSPLQVDIAPTLTSVAILQYRNVGDSKMTGVELSASGKLRGGYHWSANYTFTDVKDEPDPGFSMVVRNIAAARTTPDSRGNLAFGWENAQWQADGFLRYVGASEGYNSVGVLTPVEAHATLGGRVAYTFGPDFTLALSGQNLGHERQTQTVGLEAERRVLISLTKAW